MIICNTKYDIDEIVYVHVAINKRPLMIIGIKVYSDFMEIELTRDFNILSVNQ